MALDFSNATLLSYSQENQKFGENGLTFKTSKKISVSGLLLDLNNSNGVKNNIEASEEFLNSASVDHQDIILNGLSLGQGYVESFSVEGEFIRTADYKIELTVYEEKDLTDIEFSGGGNTLEFDGTKQNLLKKEDLKFLSNIEESISFQEGSDGAMNIQHSVSSMFLESKNIISNNFSNWNGGQKQNNKLKNLGNRAKGSLKVQAGSSAGWENANITQSSIDIGEDYILSFEFLGIDELPSIKTEAKALIDIGSGSQVELKFTSRGSKKIEFTALSASINIKLFSPSGKNSFYKNVKLFKKSETSLQRSRAISNLFLNSNPIYGIVEGIHSGIYQYSSSWEDQNSEESFDESSFQHKKSKTISYSRIINKMPGSFITPTPGVDKDYSMSRGTSLVMSPEGIIDIEETISLRVLENKTNSNLDKIIESAISGSRSRCSEKYLIYSSNFEYGCVGGDKTPLSTSSLSVNPISKKIVKNSFAFSAEITLSFSDSLKQEHEDYFHEETYNITNEGKNFTISQDGVITGGGDEVSTRYTNAKNAFRNTIEPNIPTNINTIKNNVLTLDPNTGNAFFEKGKTVNLSSHTGTVEYQYEYSNHEGQEESGNGFLKSFEIEVSESKLLQKFNEFNLGCITVAQLLGDLVTPIQRKITISAIGFNGKSVSKILEKTKEKLNEKGLMEGADSELVTVPSSTEIFLTDENFSFTKSSNELKYERTILDLSECEGAPRPTVTPDFGLHLSGIDNQFKYFPTPTPKFDFQDDTVFTPWPQTPTVLEMASYHTKTLTLTPTVTPTLTLTPTPTLTTTLTPV